MGYFKQLHIDCYEGECLANYWDTCYMQPENVSYSPDEEPEEQGTNDGGDFNAQFDIDRE